MRLRVFKKITIEKYSKIGILKSIFIYSRYDEAKYAKIREEQMDYLDPFIYHLNIFKRITKQI